ncbi:hypothetical protein IG193_02135 [Infirmifilum lucidum]|uniref:Uncharacterized protein n=1 Tax=Infirmifilum lucidum TaxID=2776706 RepID=A0A7L9FK22_9CREN|nr:hypothetical protein [Infirmifilum lucidum]QOJ79284.1 hypothetical protein IG193_02135 [Infirmifilum lucidum]
MAGCEGSARLRGQQLNTSIEVQVTPRLVRAALTKARRTGAYWKLKPAERAILVLASRLNYIRSPVLLDSILSILEKVWPQKALVIRAYEAGLRYISYKVGLALRLGARAAAEGLLALAGDARRVVLVGLSYLNTPSFYRVVL